jgi:Double zinc ribbon
VTDLELLVRWLVDRIQEKDPDATHRPVTLEDVRRALLPYRAYRNSLRLSSVEDYDLLLLRLCAEEGDYVRTNPPEAAERCRQEVAGPNPDLTLVSELDEVTVQIGAGALQRILSLEVDDLPSAAAEPVQPPSDLPLLPLDAPEPPTAGPMLEEAGLGPPVAPEPLAPATSGPGPRRPRPEPMPGRDPTLPREPAPPSEPKLRLSRPEPMPKPVLRLSRPEPDPPEPPKSAAEPAPTCPRCRESLPRTRRVVFCPFCGERVDPLRCSRCGTELEPGWKHCITCGRPTTSDGEYV